MSTIPMPHSSYEPIALNLELPWVEDEEREKKLKKNAMYACGVVVLFLTIVQFLPVFIVEEEQPKLTKTVLLLEPKELPEIPEPESEPEPVKPPKIVKKQAKTTGNVAAVPKKTPEKPDVIQAQGLDQLSSQLASLSSSVDLQKLRKKNVSSSEKGTKAQNSVSRLGADQVTRRSGGVTIDEDAMRSSASQLAARETTTVDGLDLGGGVVSTSNAYGDLRSGTRDMESVRQALEAAKSRIYVQYQRALDENPDLAGKFRFQLVIEPNGSISSLSLLYSELNLKPLEQDILALVKKVDFGEKEVVTTEVEYTYVFLPS